MTLLEQALAVKTNRVKSPVQVNPEEIDIAIEFSKGQVTIKQCATVTGIKETSMASHLFRVLYRAVKTGALVKA